MSKKEKEKTYLGRGLHSPKLKEALNEGGLLQELLEIVKSDEDLVLEIRNDYLNIYYKGGNIAKVESANNIQFDHNYFKGYQRPKFESDKKEKKRKALKKKMLSVLKKERNYHDFVSKMKDLMNDYWAWLKEDRGKSLKEKDIQHSLCINNTEQSEYTIIDVEFQVSTEAQYTYKKPSRPKGRFIASKKTSPRFDIIAVRNSDHQLCVIELKSGVNALYGKSGIGDHADSFEGTIGRMPRVFLEEIKGVINDKKDLGLLSNNFEISDNDPEFVYAYSFKSNDLDREGNYVSKQQQRALFLEEMNRMHCEQYRVIFLEENNYTLSDKMNIKIHRGTHQIGGCVTEYEYKGWRLFVDYGEELPGAPKTGDLKVEGLTHGDISKSALLITHYHGDHIGSIIKLPKGLPVYMGKVGLDIQKVLSNHLKNKIDAHKLMLERLEDVNTFKEHEEFRFGPFSIMPVMVDHSAFDAYAFKIVAAGVSVYHTGDFRLHGFRSGKTAEMLQKYVGEVDYVVCEGTNVSRPEAASKAEYSLQRDFETLFKENKGCIVYLSSTNIDRLFSLYQAAKKAHRTFYVDKYQKEVMDTVVNSGSIWTRSKLFQYGKYEPVPLIYDKFDKDNFFVADSFKKAIDEHGYVLIARANQRFDKLINQIHGEKKKVLSMWNGYVKEGLDAYNENLAKSLDEDFYYMHTSGHIDMADLREVFRLLHPKAIIPIHTEKPEAFAKVFSDEWPIIVLNDGDSFPTISSRTQ